MTVKERIKAAIKMKPLDRLLFWPKLIKPYADKWGGTLEVFFYFISSDCITGVNGVFKENSLDKYWR